MANSHEYQNPQFWLEIFSTVICVPERTCFSILASPERYPITLTGLAARISYPRLAGVGPKKIHIADPGGRYAIVPISTMSWESGSSLASIGILKYISLPQVNPLALKGKVSHRASAVGLQFKLAVTVIAPAEILILLSSIGRIIIEHF